MKKFQPDLVAVSAGFDAYVRDPLAQGVLVVDDFYRLGQSLRALGVPLLACWKAVTAATCPNSFSPTSRVWKGNNSVTTKSFLDKIKIGLNPLPDRFQPRSGGIFVDFPVPNNQKLSVRSGIFRWRS